METSNNVVFGGENEQSMEGTKGKGLMLNKTCGIYMLSVEYLKEMTSEGFQEPT